jgi:predicted TIM-barrel fold metal-dependent hydrolase
MQRRTFLIAPLALAAASSHPIVESHVHLFGDLAAFPTHPNGPRRNAPDPLENYVPFCREVGIRRAVHVSAEPYQDDHRYLEHCFTIEPEPGFIKGTVLFDTTAADTPRRLTEIVRRNPGRIVALRLHRTADPKLPPTKPGDPIRDRDLSHPNTLRVWRTAGELGVAIQAHIVPHYAPAIEALARQAPDTLLIVDHFGHAGVAGSVRGSNGIQLARGEWGYKDPAEFRKTLALAKLKRVVLKVSSLQYSSRRPYPHEDLRPLVRQAFDAFGPERLMWGSLGHSLAEFKEKAALFDTLFDFISPADKARIQGGTALDIFNFRL